MMVNDGRVKVEVLVGQIWKDKDPRGHGNREVKIERMDSVYAFVRNVRTGRKTRIYLARFTPRQNGYELITSAPIKRSEENNEGDTPCPDGIISDSTTACGGC